MQSENNGNLLEIIDLAHSLRQEHLFIANEQASFNRLNETLSRNSSNVAQVNAFSNSIEFHSVLFGWTESNMWYFYSTACLDLFTTTTESK